MKPCPYCAEQIQEAAIKCRYCGTDLQVPPVRVASSAPSKLPTSHRNALLAGAVLVLLAPLLPWVHIVLIGNENLFNAGGIAPLIGLVQMGAAVWLAVEAWRRGRRRRQLGVVVAVVTAVVDGLALIGLLHDVRQTYGLAQIGIGPWVGVAGAVTIFISSLSSPKDEIPLDMVVPKAEVSRSPRRKTAPAGAQPPYQRPLPGWARPVELDPAPDTKDPPDD